MLHSVCLNAFLINCNVSGVLQFNHTVVCCIVHVMCVAKFLEPTDHLMIYEVSVMPLCLILSYWRTFS